jgi:hypothetical protein
MAEQLCKKTVRKAKKGRNNREAAAVEENDRS